MDIYTYLDETEATNPDLSVEIPGVDENGRPVISFIDLTTKDHYWATWVQ